MKQQKVLLSIKNLQKYFPISRTSPFQIKKEFVKANKNITLDIYEGETLGIVGESGCGKSTLGRTIIQLQRQTGGSTLYYGNHIDKVAPRYMMKVYKNLTKISQSYDLDSANLQTLKSKRKTEKDFEEYRLKKIDFENKYYNTFRLIGGLAAYDNLSELSKILQSRYKVLKKQSKYKLQLDYHLAKQKLNGNVDNTILKELESKIDSFNKEFQEVETQLNKIKQSLRNNPKFKKYESFKDDGVDLSALNKQELRNIKKDLQIIFQDPYSSLDPRAKVSDIVGEGLLVHRMFNSKFDSNYQKYVLETMEKCGLDKKYSTRFPHQFSGGQRQRIGIARALALKPKFVVCDEAVSSLDVSIQSQIINLLQTLKKSDNLTYMFITHDLGVVRYISDRIGVMYFGNLVEIASAEEIFSNPKHPYTRQLLNAIPVYEDEQNKQTLYDVVYKTSDYEFNYEKTKEVDPDWFEVKPGHFVACTLKNKQEAGDLL